MFEVFHTLILVLTLVFVIIFPCFCCIRRDQEIMYVLYTNLFFRSEWIQPRLILDFRKIPSSFLFSTYQTKDFSYLIGANFSHPKWVAALLPISLTMNIPWRQNCQIELNMTSGRLRYGPGSIAKAQKLQNILYCTITCTSTRQSKHIVHMDS